VAPGNAGDLDVADMGQPVSNPLGQIALDDLA
jgi:hypothetical protein